MLPRRTSLRGSTLEPKALQWPTKVRCGNGGVASTRGFGRGVCARYFLFLPLAAFLSGAVKVSGCRPAQGERPGWGPASGNRPRTNARGGCSALWRFGGIVGAEKAARWTRARADGRLPGMWTAC